MGPYKEKDSKQEVGAMVNNLVNEILQDNLDKYMGYKVDTNDIH